jgi:hypothetical protein
MAFKEKYISKSDAQANPGHGKKEISDDAFALGEVLDEIMIQIFRSSR